MGCGGDLFGTVLSLVRWYSFEGALVALALLFKLFRFSRHLIQRDLFMVIGLAEQIILVSDVV